MRDIILWYMPGDSVSVLIHDFMYRTSISQIANKFNRS